MDSYDNLKIENQLCLPLYIASKQIIASYAPYLEPLDLTYTQYIVMLVLWEYGESDVNAIGGHLHLDSGTLSPVLKKLEAKGYIKREPSKEDARHLLISLSDEGEALKEKATLVPPQVATCLHLSIKEARELQAILSKIID